MPVIVSVTALTRVFDVSKPWLNRLIERLPKRTLTAVSDVSFDIEENTVYALVGESGSGKSTIGKMIVGLLPPSEGTVRIEGLCLPQSALEGGQYHRRASRGQWREHGWLGREVT